MITLAMIVFVLSIAALGYTYAGYPALLWGWARWRPRPHRTAPVTADAPSVVVVIVAFNEAERIDAKIATCLAQDYPRERLRILVVSDGSTDDTVARVQAYAPERVAVLACPQRRGKAACLNDAVAVCDEEIIVFNDVRQRLNPEAVRMLVENFGDPAVGAASGELMFVDVDGSPFAAGVDAYWRYEKFIRRLEGRVASVVGATGALYAVRRSVFVPIPPDTVLDDVLIPMNIVLQGARVVFEPRAHAYDRPSTSPAQERVRKVRTLAGNFLLMRDHPALLLPGRHAIVLQFWSHKTLRLLAPVFMATALIANAALAVAVDGAWAWVWRGVLAAHLGGYALALIGHLVPSAGRITLVRLASAFVALNAFVVLGFIEFVSNKNVHVWRSKT